MTGTQAPLSPRDELLWQRATEAADAATEEAVEALRGAAIRCVLLRGPAFARRLYDAGERRYYDDGDLLVDDVALAEGPQQELMGVVGLPPRPRELPVRVGEEQGEAGRRRLRRMEQRAGRADRSEGRRASPL